MADRNLRIVSTNVADTATITAANTASGLGTDWLKTELKSEVCRILSGTGALTLTWPDLVGIDCVAIPAWNGSASSEVRVRVYDAVSAGNLLYDSGWLWAAPGPQLGVYGFSQPLNVNHFVDGATVTAVWVPNIAGRRVVIDLKDPNRTMLDISRVVVGTAFSLCGASYGSGVSANDSTTTTRTAGGDTKIDRGMAHRTMGLNLNYIPKESRHEAVRIINAGLGKRHFVSGYTDDSDVMLQQELMMYGVLTTVPGLTYANYNINTAQFQIEEW
ncbi:hypothetical protein H0A65_10870 [Alcaligenaceae bacterium]|nr:hypothetical protein [Alcaligenaceae bacterium]